MCLPAYFGGPTTGTKKIKPRYSMGKVSGVGDVSSPPPVYGGDVEDHAYIEGGNVSKTVR